MTARSLAIALTLLLVFVQYQLWFAADGIAQTIDLNHSIASEMKTDQQFEKIIINGICELFRVKIALCVCS